MSDPRNYLYFSDSTYAEGKVVGTSADITHGNGLTNSNVKEVQIPSSIDNKNIIEIGYNAFCKTKIISVFIPKTVLYLNRGALQTCSELQEIRFEEGSKLEKIGYECFYACSTISGKITKFLLPNKITEINV